MASAERTRPASGPETVATPGGQQEEQERWGRGLTGAAVAGLPDKAATHGAASGSERLPPVPASARRPAEAADGATDGTSAPAEGAVDVAGGLKKTSENYLKTDQKDLTENDISEASQMHAVGFKPKEQQSEHEAKTAENTAKSDVNLVVKKVAKKARRLKINCSKSAEVIPTGIASPEQMRQVQSTGTVEAAESKPNTDVDLPQKRMIKKVRNLTLDCSKNAEADPADSILVVGAKDTKEVKNVPKRRKTTELQAHPQLLHDTKEELPDSGISRAVDPAQNDTSAQVVSHLRKSHSSQKGRCVQPADTHDVGRTDDINNNKLSENAAAREPNTLESDQANRRVSVTTSETSSDRSQLHPQREAGDVGRSVLAPEPGLTVRSAAPLTATARRPSGVPVTIEVTEPPLPPGAARGAQELLDGAARKLSGDVVQKLPHDTAQKLPGDAVQKLPHGAAQKLPPGDAVQKLPGDVVQKLPHDTAQKLPGNAVQKLLHGATQKMPGDEAQKLPDGAAHGWPEHRPDRWRCASNSEHEDGSGSLSSGVRPERSGRASPLRTWSRKASETATGDQEAVDPSAKSVGPQSIEDGNASKTKTPPSTVLPYRVSLNGNASERTEATDEHRNADEKPKISDVKTAAAPSLLTASGSTGAEMHHSSKKNVKSAPGSAVLDKATPAPVEQDAAIKKGSAKNVSQAMEQKPSTLTQTPTVGEKGTCSFNPTGTHSPKAALPETSSSVECIHLGDVGPDQRLPAKKPPRKVAPLPPKPSVPAQSDSGASSVGNQNAPPGRVAVKKPGTRPVNVQNGDIPPVRKVKLVKKRLDPSAEIKHIKLTPVQRANGIAATGNNLSRLSPFLLADQERKNALNSNRSNASKSMSAARLSSSDALHASKNGDNREVTGTSNKKSAKTSRSAKQSGNHAKHKVKSKGSKHSRRNDCADGQLVESATLSPEPSKAKSKTRSSGKSGDRNSRSAPGIPSRKSVSSSVSESCSSSEEDSEEELSPLEKAKRRIREEKEREEARKIEKFRQRGQKAKMKMERLRMEDDPVTYMQNPANHRFAFRIKREDLERQQKQNQENTIIGIQGAVPAPADGVTSREAGGRLPAVDDIDEAPFDRRRGPLGGPPPRFRQYSADDFHLLRVLGKGAFGKVESISSGSVPFKNEGICGR
ncbi:uncharacterized protein LOC119098640 [Pollicipes pollicipes]|uniref:uncharacterized protein LOC119098640 n=1 Tax=Pollicipes pollicipes TaxID=41117 RepID=UPI0018857FDE|nr:uncharacterized protein LOC119098640 [Pollicipes pollicipes]